MIKFKVIPEMLALLSMTILLGCASTPKEEFSGISKLIYHFQDSSVPPKYHRSYTIEITDKSSSCVIDSYGEIISSKQNVEQPALLTSFEKILADNKSKRCGKTVSNGKGCTGGTGESISITKNDKILFDENVYHCGGEDFGKLCGALLDAIKTNLEKIKCK
jgi:hypothetical protein